MSPTPLRRLVLYLIKYRRHRISYYFLTDDNFCRNRHWETILDGLIRLRTEEGIRLAFMVQVDTQSYKLPRFVEKAKAAGCSQVFSGLESLNAQNLAAAYAMAFAPVAARIASVLLRLGEAFGATLPVTRRQVAELAGTTVETAIRVTNRLRRDQMLRMRRGEIVLRDPAGLRHRLRPATHGGPTPPAI